MMLMFLMPGCSLLSKDAIEDRYDADGDGVPWPDDCDDADADLQEGSTFYADADGDGFGDPGVAVEGCSPLDGHVTDGSDCDDTERGVNPQAEEACDGLDNDCNGLVDDDASDAMVMYIDSDGDGYGTTDSETSQCSTLPEGYSELSGDCDDEDPTAFPGAPIACSSDDQNCDGKPDNSDGDQDGFRGCDECDDTNPLIHPDADELCDGLDNDCDEEVDEEPVDGLTYFRDLDADGYGDAGNATSACSLPEGYADNPDDCSDTILVIHPGADELCDGVDNNCDDRIDEPDAIDAAVWYTDGDGDGYGDPSLTELSCDQPKGTVSNGDDCDDTDTRFNPGASEDCADSTDWNCDGATGYVDGDKDGYAACEECDDGDASIFPGADESCDTVDNDCDGVIDEPDAIDVSTWYTDADGDSYGDPNVTVEACDAPVGTSANADDCDDTDTDINPAVLELCDGVDNNCDSAVDEATAADAVTWYLDGDGDGYGGGGTTDACDQPKGYASDPDDCDDAVATTYPGADEYCDGVDNDCNAVVDEASSVDALTWYADSDGDGRGDPTNTTVRCTLPTGYVGTADDCDDTDPKVWKGALWFPDVDGDGYGDSSKPLSICGSSTSGLVTNDGDCDDWDSAINPDALEVCDPLDEDEDCDGLVDDDDSPVFATLVFYPDSDGDGYGATDGTPIFACDPTTGYVSDNRDCNDFSASVHPGAGDCGFLGGSLGADTAASAKIIGSGADEVGTAVSNAGDMDGDGRDDLLIGAPGANEAVLMLWPVSGVVSTSTADAIFEGESLGDDAGQQVLGLGDVNGDHYDDLAIAGPGASTNTGVAYVIRGPTSGVVDLGTADAVLNGESTLGALGSQLGAGDFNDDGLADLLIGAPLVGSTLSEGAAYLLLGPVTTDVASPQAKVVGGIGDNVGEAFDVGDVDGDGIDDLLVGISGGSGSAHVMLGPLTGTLDISTAWWELTGESGGDQAGTAVASGDDLNGDGRDDFLVGAPREDTGGSNAGAAYVVYGDSVGGTSSLSVAQAKLRGQSNNDNAGETVSMAGDVDGDGVGDLLVGAPSANLSGSNQGAGYVVLGPVTGSVSLVFYNARFTGESSQDYLGASLTGGLSLDGVGRSDLLIGIPGEDTGGGGAGAVIAIRSEEL